MEPTVSMINRRSFLGLLGTIATVPFQSKRSYFFFGGIFRPKPDIKQVIGIVNRIWNEGNDKMAEVLLTAWPNDFTLDAHKITPYLRPLTYRINPEVQTKELQSGALASLTEKGYLITI